MKKIVGILLCFGMLLPLLTACGSVDEPCMYCSGEPSKEYKKSDDTVVYVCKECSSECFFCGKKATKCYESIAGIVFVCGECYEEMVTE